MNTLCSLIHTHPAALRCPPPASFRRAGDVFEAHFTTEPVFAQGRRHTGRKAVGVRYERKVQQYLETQYGEEYRRGPWIRFRRLHGPWRWCQPDGLLILGASRILVVEVKYAHTADAWWQVRELYIPVLRHMYPSFMFEACEVVKWYDPVVAFPEEVLMAPTIDYPTDKFKVHILTPTKCR